MLLRRLALVLSCTISVTALTQSFTPVRELKNLSPAAIEKLHTLETLNALPGGDWRFHAGDIPHGESPTLDDSSWTLVPTPEPRHTVKASKEAVWYRRTIEVPKTLNGYDITGARIWFQFQADANGPMPQIIYFNGRRVALGDDLEPIVLFEPAHPGDKILVAVKLLHTVDDKSFRGVSLRVDPDPQATHNRPSPDDIRTEIVTAANILPALPTPRKDLLPKLESAIDAIDLAALAAANQAAFDASLRRAQTILAELRPALAQADITLAGNSHIDAAWLWPRSETIDVVRRTFITALQLMDEYPGYTFTQSAAQYSAWMADKYPDINAQIKQRIKDGRWQIVGGMWVEPDLNLPGGESLVRQLLVGQRFFQKEYGVTARIGWNPDSFGYNWQLPQIYKRSGMDYFVTQKMHWNDTNTLPFRLFWWQSPDGSKVLTYFPTDYAWDNVNPTRLSADFAESVQRNPGLTQHLDLYGIGDHGGGPTRSILDQAQKWIAASSTGGEETLRSPSIPAERNRAEAPEVIPTKATGASRYPEASASQATAPKRISASRYLEASASQAIAPKGIDASRYPEASASGLMARQGTGLQPLGYAVPTLHFGTPQSYFTEVEQHLNPNSPTWNYDLIAKGYTPPPAGPNGAFGLPTWNDELYFEYHRGIFTTQAHHKENMRRSEAATLDAEKFASLAWLQGQPYPADALTENWKKITFNQFHDLAAGSGVAVIYRDAQKDYTEVFHSDALMNDSAMKSIAARIDTAKGELPGEVPIIVSNSLPWERLDTVEADVQLPTGAAPQSFRDAAGNYFGFEVLNPGPANGSYHVRLHMTDRLLTTRVPSLGYIVLHASPKPPPRKPRPSDEPSTESARDITISYGYGDLRIDKATGCITSIREFLPGGPVPFLAPGGCGNQLQAFADNPKQYDAWNVDPGTLDNAPTILDKADSVRLVTDSPLRKVVRIERTFNKSHITQDVIADIAAEHIDIATTVDWHETHVLLKAAFPLAASSPKATYEIPFGSITRPTTRNNSWEKAQFEVPAQQWADLGDEHQGVSILNDSKYGYDALGNTLRLTLLRSPTWPDPDADRGPQQFTYEIYPHTGPWQAAQTVHRAYELNNPLHAEQTFSHTGSLPPTHSFVSLDAPNVTLTAIKKAEDADALIFRMYEWAGKATKFKLHIPPGATYAVETNLMEKPEGPHLPLNADTVTVTVPIKPYEILTIQAAYPQSAPVK